MRQLLVLLATACQPAEAPPVPRPVPTASVAATAACAQTLTVKAGIRGSWFGQVDSAWHPAALAVYVTDTHLGPEADRSVATIPLAEPFFAADVRLAELCSDSSGSPIDVQCVTGAGRIGRVTVHTAGDGLDVSVDGAPAHTWHLQGASPGTCYHLEGLGVSHDLEPARAAWGRDFASARCGTTVRKRPLEVVLDFTRLKTAGTANVLLGIPAMHWQTDLGEMSNLGGGLHPQRFDDAEAIWVESNDMGVERRYAWRLGDRFYFVEGGDHVSSIDLPCGVNVAFDVRGASVLESPHARLR